MHPLTRITFIFASISTTLSTVRLKYSIMEEKDSGSFVGSVRGDSKLTSKVNRDQFSELQFDFLAEGYPYTNLFRIGRSTGILRTDSVIDREVVCKKNSKCDLDLLIGVLTASNTIFDIVPVTVTIEDRNDNFPKFSPNFVMLNIPESATPGDLFPLPSATDMDSGLFSIQSFKLDTPMSTFDIHYSENDDNNYDLSLVIMEKLDHEHADFYKLTVVAKDGGSPPGTGYLKIHVSVIDSNDHRPVFAKDVYEVRYPENTATGTVLLTVSAKDLDAGMNGEVRYSLASQTSESLLNIFSVNSKSGDVQLVGSMDYEKAHRYQFTIQASDRGIKPQTSRTLVVVTVDNVNDNKPVIHLNMPSEISETALPGSYIAHMSVLDPDKLGTSKLRCSIDSRDFILKKLPKVGNMFKIMLNTSLDREKKEKYDLTVTCSDGGQPEMTEVRTFLIKVGDINDHHPVFTKRIYHKSIKENIKLNSTILRVKATDKDTGPNSEIKYSLSRNVNHVFRIDEYFGVITTIAHLDREFKSGYEFQVFAEDGGVKANSATAQVSVKVLDVNDEPPVFPQSVYMFSVVEHSDKETVVGNVSAVDADLPGNDHTVFSILAPADSMTSIPFTVGRKDGVIRTKKEFDHENEDRYHFTIIASDEERAYLTSSALVTVKILDTNDNYPIFIFPNSYNHTIETFHHYGVGSVIGRIEARDRDSGLNGKLVYEIVQGNEHGMFKVDKHTGKIQLGRKLSTHDANRVYNLVITVSDSGSKPKTAWENLKISVQVSNTTLLGADKITNGGKGMGLNLIFIIAIIAGGVLIFIILIILVTLLITRWRSHRPRPRYYLKSETQKMMSPSHVYTTPQNMSQCTTMSDPVQGKHNNTTTTTDTNSSKGDNSFYAPANVSHESMQTTLSTFKTQSPVSSPIDHHALQYPKACSSMLAVNRSNSPDHNSTLVNDIMTSPKRGRHRFVGPPHSKFLQLKPCHDRAPHTDAHSSSTGDMTSDSGCGPSEEDSHCIDKSLTKDSTLPRRLVAHPSTPTYQSPREDGVDRVTQWMTSQNDSPSCSSPPPYSTLAQQARDSTLQKQRENNLTNLNSYGGSVANNSPSMSQFIEMDSLSKKRPINTVLPSTYIDYKYPVMESDARISDAKKLNSSPSADAIVLRGSNTGKGSRSQRVSFRHPIDDASHISENLYEDDGDTTTSGSYILSADDLYDKDVAATLPRGIAC